MSRPANGGGASATKTPTGRRPSPPPTRFTFRSGGRCISRLTSPGRHPHLLGAGSGRQDRHHPRPDQRDVARGRQARRLPRPVLGILRRSSTPQMVFSVIAEPPSAVRGLAHGSAAARRRRPTAGSRAAGEQRFIGRCGDCHTVRGTPANGPRRARPDPPHVAQRPSLAANCPTIPASCPAGSPIRRGSSPARSCPIRNCPGRISRASDRFSLRSSEETAHDRRRIRSRP